MPIAMHGFHLHLHLLILLAAPLLSFVITAFVPHTEVINAAVIHRHIHPRRHHGKVQVVHRLAASLLRARARESAAAGSSTNSSRSRSSAKNKNKRDAIMEIMLNRTPCTSTSGEWHKFRQYTYKTNLSTLSQTQIESVLAYLDDTLGSIDRTNAVLQSTPRIMRKSVDTQLMPTVKFLQTIYQPRDLFLLAIERNPNLLVTTGVGYRSVSTSSGSGGSSGELSIEGNDGTEKQYGVEDYLMEELSLKQTTINNLKKSNPMIFQFSVEDQVRPVTQYLASIMESLVKKSDSKSNDSNLHFASVGKVVKDYPNVLGLNVELNLKPKIQFLMDRCAMKSQEVAKVIADYPECLGLSLEVNLRPSLDYLSNVLLDYDLDGSLDVDEPEEEIGMWREDASSLLRKCISRHPQILGLSATNLKAKVAYFDAIDSITSVERALSEAGEMADSDRIILDVRNAEKSKDLPRSLAARVLLAAPSAYSLNLQGNLMPTIDLLGRLWGSPVHKLFVDDESTEPTGAVRDDSGCRIKPLPFHRQNALSLSALVAESPTVLTLSLEGNLRPTVAFYNSTGYTCLDEEGDLIPANKTAGRTTTIRARYLASSLYKRLLPRWYYFKQQVEAQEPSADFCDEEKSRLIDTKRPPLHLLAGASDATFCSKLGFDLSKYETYREEESEKLKFNVQFATWVKTGRPID